jgi:hypothetical protein
MLTAAGRNARAGGIDWSSPWPIQPVDASQQSVAFNADLGDGGTAFRHRSMTTILRSAKRRLERLATGYRNAGDIRRAEVAEYAQLELQELFGRVHYLGNATDETSFLWTLKRLEAEGWVARSGRRRLHRGALRSAVLTAARG